jgi:hypothetical protein
MLEPPPSSEPTPKNQVRSLMFIVACGFVIVIVSLLLLNWPSGQWGESDVTMIPQIQRTIAAVTGKIAWPLPRLILDVGIYILLVIGLGFLVAAWRSGARGALMGLLAISILGLSYVSGMVVYVGPMISACGFVLILFGGLVAWASSPRHNLPEEPPIDDRGTDEYASHPVT